ncbi:MAG: hypothetical protein ACRC6V_09400 [Bacteroidales bacterium]
MSSNIYWLQKSGEPISVDEMTDLHVFNTVKMIFKREGMSFYDMPEDVCVARRWLKDEIKRHCKTPIRVNCAKVFVW